MAINWAERLDNIKNNVKTDMENTSTNRWAAILDQGRANQKFQGLQIKLSDFENSKSGFEKSANSFTSGWQDEKATNNFYSSFGNFYAEAEAIRQDLEENAAAYKSILGDEKYKTIYDSFNTVSKNKDSDLEGFKRRGDLYSKYKTADEYNIAVKNQGYADKYKNYTYQQIDKFLNSDNYKTMRRRGIIDESEALWLKNQKYALATAKEVESELKNKKTLFAGNRTNENFDFNFNQPKKFFEEAELTKLLDETKVKNEEWAKSKGYKNYAEYLREYPDFEGEIEVLETVLAQKQKQENFNEKWGDVNVEGGYTPKINKNETDNLYGQINNIVPDGWITEKDTKTKAKYLRDRAVTDADYIAEMSPQEKAKYNKIYDTQGIKKANEYYEDLVSLSLDKRVNEKEFQKAYDFTSSGGLNAVIGNIASVGDSLSSGVEFVANNLMGETNKRVVSATRSQGFREGTKTHWDGAWGEDVWDFLYDTGMSGVDSAAAAGLSAVVPYLGEVLLGGSAAASTYNDALDRGISHGDAMLTALTAGVAESLFEHMSISKFLDAGDITKGFTKAGLKQATKTLLTEMGVNFSEELFTEVSNIITDTAINGNLSNYAIAVKDYYMQGMSPEEAKNKALADFGKQILEAGASGALMGFGFGSISSIKGMARSQVLNSQKGGLVKLSGNVAELKTVAELSNNEEIKAAAEKLTETSKPSEIGYVYNSLVADAVEQSVKEMTPVLLENGAKESGSNSAKGWATQIAGSIFEGNQSKIANLQYNKVTSGVYDAFTKEGKYGGDKLLNLKNIISTPYLNQKTTASEVDTVLNENGIEAPVAADGSGVAVGSVMGDTVKGIAAAPRSGEIRTITEAYKQGVAENLEKQRPNPKTMSEEEFMKTYFAEEVQISPEEEKVLKDFGKANGLEVEFVDGAVNGKGYGVFQNGKQIVISRYAKKPMAALFKHEFTHSVEKAKGYAKFQEYVLEESEAFKGWLNAKGFADWAELSNSIVKNYEESGVDYEDPYIKAKADIIADFVGDVLFGEVVDAKGNPIKLDTNFLVELKKNDRNLFQRFVEWVHSILKRLTTKGVVNKDIVKLEQKFKRLAEQSVKEREKTKTKQSESGKTDGQYSLAENKKITLNMSESERADILRSSKIATVNYAEPKNSGIDFKYLESAIKSKAEKHLLKKLQSLGYLKHYTTNAIDVEFDFTMGGLRKSTHSQLEYGGNYSDFAKVVVSLQELLDSSLLIETHSDKAKGTPRENNRLKQVYVLLSALNDGDNIIPVQFEIKQFIDDNNRLYLAVALTKIETGVMGNTVLENQTQTNLLPVSSISIPELFSKINPKDKKFLKYVPDEFLNAEQKTAKQKALKEDYIKYGQKDGQYSLPQLDTEYMKAVESGDMETAQRLVEEVARANGYTQKLYHGTTRFGFTKIETSDVEELVAWSPFFATDSVETAGTYSGDQSIKKIADSLMQTDEDRAKILKAIQSESIDFAEFCNSQLGIRGWIDYDYFSNKINECVESLENGTKLSEVKEEFEGFCDEIFYTFIDNYYYENYNEKELTLEAFEDSKEYEDLSDKFYDYVNTIVGQFNSFDYESTSGIYDLYANTEGLFEFDAKGEKWNRLPDPREADGKSGITEEFGFRMFKTRDYAKYAKENGYKGVKITNVFDDGGKSVQRQTKPATVYIFFNPQEQVKSADPVTYDDDGNVIPLSQRFNPENEDIRYSLPDLDSTGQKLSAGQMEYFKDSKVKDGKGRLIPVYHGSKSAGFTEFTKSDEIGYFFARTIKTSRTYAGGSKAIYAPDKNSPEFSGAANYKVYLDIKKPYIIDGNGANWNQLEANGERVDISIKSQKWNNGSGIAKIQFKYNGKTYSQTVRTSEEFENFISKHTNPEMAKAFAYAMGQAVDKNGKGEFNAGFIWDFKNSVQGDTKNTRDIVRKAYNSHWNYDGVIFKNVVDSGDGSKIKADDLYVVFDSNQIKSVNNTNPTEDKDIRYSLPDIPDIARGKNSDELHTLVDEGKITNDEAMAELSKQFGTMPKGENPKVDVDVPNKVSDTKGVRRFARTALESGHLTEGMSEDAKREIINGALNYEISSNKMVTNIAEKKVAKDINKAIQEWEGLIASGRIPTAGEIALGEVLLVEAAKADNANDVAMYLSELAALGTQLGQGIQALSLLKKLTGVGQLHYVSRVIAQMNEDLKRRYGDKFQDVLSVDPNLEEILAKSKNQAEIEEVIDDILTDVAKQMPSTWLDKFNAWRYLAMLGNTRTHIRNFFGNAIFLPAIRIKDALGTIGERMFIKDVSHRTKVFKVNKKYREYAMKDFEEVKGLLTRGGKMNPSDIVQDRRKIFTSKLFAPVEKFRKFNFDMLEKEDLIFLKKHYIHALGSVLQSRGLDVNNITEQQLKDARDYAINEAQKATYRDFSFFANMLNKLAHPTKNGKPVRDVATKGLAVLVEGALPFKKTPINILKRGIEYSPIGIATSIGNAILAARRGEYSGAEFIDGITAGMTGTMILGLGMLLQSMGWLVGGLGYDDEDALERLSGAQPYAIDFGEFARDLGFDVDGGVSYTIDWMAPSSLPLLIGAEVSKALAQDEDGQISDLLLAIAEPMTELSFLQGVNDIIEGVAYSGENGLGVTGEVVTNLASTYVSQYFPTLTGQVARTFDDTRRANFVDKSSAVPKTLQKTAQKILGKIPFAENQKIPYIDAWGRTEENDNFLLRAFENFVSPGYVSKIEDDKVNNELAKVYTNTGESGVIPKKAGTSFSVNGKMVYLDAEKYVQYATDKGQYSRRYLEEMMSGGLYNGLSSDGKAEAIAFLFSYANAKAKSNVSDYDYREVSTYKTAAKLEDAGISPASYAVAKFAMSKENADTDGSGSVSKSEKQKALRNAGFSSRDANKILNINKK